MHENVYKTWNVYELMIKLEFSGMFYELNFHIFLNKPVNSIEFYLTDYNLR